MTADPRAPGAAVEPAPEQPARSEPAGRAAPATAAPERPERPTAGRTRDLARRPNPIERIADVWRYRELLANLVRKELKVKYKNSILGFAWSLLNPAMYLVIFWIVFEKILGSSITNFPIFLLAGLIPWTLFSNGLNAGASSIADNGSLVAKVWFPREILPVASIGAALVHYFLQSIVLVAGLLVFRWVPSGEFSLLLVPALLTLVLFLTALTILLSAVNVYLRDTKHLLELVTLAWFWLTPIVYSYNQVADKLGRLGSLFLANPVTPVIITFQRAIYNKTSVGTPPNTVQILPDASAWWYLRNLGIVAAGSIALLFVALWIFGRLEDNFVEEI